MVRTVVRIGEDEGDDEGDGEGDGDDEGNGDIDDRRGAP